MTTKQIESLKVGDRILATYYPYFSVKEFSVDEISELCVKLSGEWYTKQGLDNWRLIEVLKPQPDEDEEVQPLVNGESVETQDVSKDLEKQLNEKDAKIEELMGMVNDAEFNLHLYKQELSNFDLNRMRLIKKLEAMCDWKEGACWYLVYNIKFKKFDDFLTTNLARWEGLEFRFASKESLDKAIAEMGQEALEIIFGIRKEGQDAE